MKGNIQYYLEGYLEAINDLHRTFRKSPLSLEGKLCLECANELYQKLFFRTGQMIFKYIEERLNSVQDNTEGREDFFKWILAKRKKPWTAPEITEISKQEFETKIKGR